MALEIKDLGVKFYASKTKAEALALATLPGDAAEPGAICFVSDNTGNYIIVDGKIFGDGASGGGGGSSGGGGAVDSVNGKTGVVVLDLSDFPVATIDGETKSLSDYFNSDGTVVSDSFVVNDIDGSGNVTQVISIDKSGIIINNSRVATQAWVEDYVSTIQSNINNNITNQIDNLREELQQYTDQKSTSVYKPKGSVQTYQNLLDIENPEVGDVYNVVRQNGSIPAGTNYVYTSDGEWDALGGSVDLSNYKTAAQTEADINNALQQSKTYTDNSVVSIRTTVDGHSTQISNLMATTNTHTLQLSNAETNIENNTIQINQNTTNINNLANQMTWQ